MILLIDKFKNTMKIDLKDIKIYKKPDIKKHTTLKDFNEEIKKFLKGDE